MGAVGFEEDYGAFRVMLVDGDRIPPGLWQASLPFVRDEQNLVVANGYRIDGAAPRPVFEAIPRDQIYGTPLSPGLDPLAGLYLVQFRGPVKDEWVEALRRTGARWQQYVAMNAYVVRMQPHEVGQLEALVAWHPAIQMATEWHPAFKMTPQIRALSREPAFGAVPVTVQLADDRGVRDSLQRLAALNTGELFMQRVGRYLNVRVDIDAQRLTEVAFLPAVFAVEIRGVRTLLDEAQGQIVAGNLTGSAPTGPGYLAWVAGRGFDASQFGSFSVNVVDDATSLTGHPDLASSRVSFALNPTGQGGAQGGHGFLNAHIVAGFNDSSGTAFEDSNGFNYGLGIAPWARVGSTAIFGGGGSSPTSWESSAYGFDARISTNSWGFTSFGSPIPDYDSNAQEYDVIVRDAQSGVAGLQELAVTFAAGNDGSGSNTVSTPSTAKNVITCGASENWRQTGTDGCAISNAGANSADDIIGFSSRGPVNASGGDGRWKPEIVAPGTHVQAGVPQSNFSGSSVCNGFWPSGQTLYGWSSGTSHSTPAVAGGMALVYQDFLNKGLGTPSPAMIKAYLANSATHMTGVGANDTLPSNSQGMGRMDLGRAFDGVSRVLQDQAQLLTASGAVHSVNATVVDGSRPVRVTLVWTDDAGPTTGAPWVNNLDLTVSIGGNTYRGNVFSGATSTTGGTADIRNNCESVFLPAGTTGVMTVTVTATSIGGDGVPGNGDPTDQDFALVIYNGTTATGPIPPTASFTGDPTSGFNPLTVDFTNQSTGTVSSLSWDFGDGNTSTATNPTHTYTANGTYSVTLTVTGSAGSDSLTRTDYITVSSPPPGGVSDGSFELQTAGSTPTTPWSVTSGTGHVVNPAGGTTSDNGMPSDGTQWGEISAESTNNATPPSNPGGVTNPPVGGAGISTTFTYAAGASELNFDAAFLRNESANSTFNDWMSVDISDGSTTVNLYFKDTSSPTSGTSAKYGYAMTPVETTTADLAVLFPSSTPSTLFTFTAQVGNGTDGIQASRGYIDNVRLEGLVGVPTAEFSGTPTSGTVPLAVSFTDLSTGSVTGWAWDFGDGATSSAQNPSHTYTAAGTYTVALTATGSGGSNTNTKVGFIPVTEPAPVAGFSGTPTSGTAPLTVSFSDQSTGAVTSWAWDFGDGNTSSAQNPREPNTDE